MALFCIGCLDVECLCGMLVLCDTAVPPGIQDMVSPRGIQCPAPPVLVRKYRGRSCETQYRLLCYAGSTGIPLPERCVVSIADKRNYRLL